MFCVSVKKVRGELGELLISGLAGSGWFTSSLAIPPRGISSSCWTANCRDRGGGRREGEEVEGERRKRKKRRRRRWKKRKGRRWKERRRVESLQQPIVATSSGAARVQGLPAPPPPEVHHSGPF